MVFGWYSFLIKMFRPEELEWLPEDFDGTTIEIRQKVFHIFWIPIFPIGKLYAFRMGDSLYELPGAYEAVLKEMGVAKTPWYSFAGPLAIGARGEGHP